MASARCVRTRFSMTDRQIDATATSLHAHARSCKKAPNACKECVAAMKWFGELPLATLARVLSELEYMSAIRQITINR